MGFFSFVKNIGRKVAGAAKVVLGKGKDMLKQGVSIGNKIINNPISKKIIDVASPFLSVTPIGRAALLGIKGAQTGLKMGESLLSGIDTAEKVGKNIQKIRQGDLSGISDIVGDVKKGIELGKGLRDNTGEFKSTVIDIKKQFSE